MQFTMEELENTNFADLYVPTSDQARAEIMIERIRQYNRSIGDGFIGHACGCVPSGGTVWRLAYQPDAFEAAKAAMFNEVFAEDILNETAFVHNVSPLDELFGETPAQKLKRMAEPCVCPFSLR